MAYKGKTEKWFVMSSLLHTSKWFWCMKDEHTVRKKLLEWGKYCSPFKMSERDGMYYKVGRKHSKEWINRVLHSIGRQSICSDASVTALKHT